MIILESGNLFDSSYQCFGVTANAFGAMGAGIAKECKQRFPEVFDEYAHACRRKHFEEQRLLKVAIVPLGDPDEEPRFVLCIQTKYHWIYPSTYELVEQSLAAIRDQYEALEITSMALPLLGCSNGKLAPERVRALTEQYLDPLPIPIGLYISM
jgi:O-acetyl-ADP-ribose deacetylase (regulator of RNase III)